MSSGQPLSYSSLNTLERMEMVIWSQGISVRMCATSVPFQVISMYNEGYESFESRVARMSAQLLRVPKGHQHS